MVSHLHFYLTPGPILTLAFALQTQQRYAQGLADGAFADEIVPVDLPAKKGVSQRLEADEHPRGQTTPESLAKLPSVFIKGSGTVTAGNASGICDGAAVNIVMSEGAVKKYNVRPLARIAAYAWSACEPEIMGIGPVVSVQQALAKAGKTVGDMDLIEVNEVGASADITHVEKTKTDNRLSPPSGSPFSANLNSPTKRQMSLAAQLPWDTLSPLRERESSLTSHTTSTAWTNSGLWALLALVADRVLPLSSSVCSV